MCVPNLIGGQGDWIKGDFQDCLVAKPEIDVNWDV